MSERQSASNMLLSCAVSTSMNVVGSFVWSSTKRSEKTRWHSCTQSRSIESDVSKYLVSAWREGGEIAPQRLVSNVCDGGRRGGRVT